MDTSLMTEVTAPPIGGRSGTSTLPTDALAGDPHRLTPVTGSDVTVVVVTYRAARFLADTLAGLDLQTVDHRLLVIDNASTDGTADVLDRVAPAGTVRRMPANLGFAGGVAAALAEVGTRFVALLNDDAVPAPDWLEQLLAIARDDREAAAWTSLMLLADSPDTVNNFGTELNDRWYGVDVDAGIPVDRIPDQVVDVFGFSGGAALMRTDAVRAVGGFPAEYFVYYEDLDTSWRLRRAGWRIRAVPAARVVHRHAATSDTRSRMFHYYNERNRLLTLLRCAPLPVALAQFGRFALTTGSLAARRIRHRAEPRPANFDPRLRLRVLRDALTMAPGALRHR